MIKTFIAVGVSLSFSFAATADPRDQIVDNSEALAWSVAAYASCDSPTILQADFKEEVRNLNANILDILAALHILGDATNVCGELNLFANDMLAIANSDVALLESRLGYEKQPAKPVFVVEEPKGAGASSSLILRAASDTPPLSGSDPQSSDYKQ